MPTRDEVVEIAVEHLENAEDAIISFGQGCEGEPTLQADLIVEAVRLTRAATRRGTVNINTNAGDTDAIRRVCEAGVDSLRVSLVSARPDRYHAYHRPAGYELRDVVESIKVAKALGAFVSINYLCYPGFSDTEPEVDALADFIDETGIDMLQLAT